MLGGRDIENDEAVSKCEGVVKLQTFKRAPRDPIRTLRNPYGP
jgi:hypothetical protein